MPGKPFIETDRPAKREETHGYHFTGSGSPYAWRVAAPEHKSLAYDLRAISFSDGDITKPEFSSSIPASRAVIVDGDFSLYESAVPRYLTSTLFRSTFISR
jgi:hypothetical protein